jgi:putative transposase
MVNGLFDATQPAYDLPCLGYRRRCAAELAEAQRRMSRRRRAAGQVPSSGYLRAPRQAAKLHKKAASQIKQAARIWTNRVVDNHQMIAVKGLRPLFLAKSTMAHKSADAAIGTAKAELIEGGTRAGRTVVKVPPAYTTMTSSRFCGRQARLEPAMGTFRCANCGFTAGRDRNAA